MMPEDDFSPPRWLRNPHLQSALPSLPARRKWVMPRVAPVLEASRELLLDCGDKVTLQAFHSRPRQQGPAAGKVAVLLHGWEGSAESLYILSLAQQLFARGFDVMRLNLRDHGATHHLNRELFHSCRLPEVIGALRAIQTLTGSERLYLAGFSLGGNFMLRAAADANKESLPIERAIAVSPVLDPGETLAALEGGIWTYHWYFARRWFNSLLKKQAAWPQDYDFSTFARSLNLRHMTAELVRRFTEFPSLEEYLEGYAITGSRLARLAVPATIITSLDDPIIPARGLERLARSAALRIITTSRGGHCGFMETLSAPSWAERRIVADWDPSFLAA
jgi:predicted alpha/beta-fold hydrolase